MANLPRMIRGAALTNRKKYKAMRSAPSEQSDYISDRETKSGKTVAFYSLEMESSEIYERLLSKMAQIPMNTLIERGARAGNVALKFCSNN